MSFGYSILGFGAHPSRGIPLAVSIVIDGSAPLVDLIENLATAGSGAFVTGSSGVPIWDVSVVATGGSGSYTYAWSNLEVRNPSAVFSVNSAGTTNAARYNTLAMNGTIPASALDPPNDCLYTLSCRVQDGAGGDITVSQDCAIVAIPL